MMSLTNPKIDKIEEKRRKELVELCGKNRGPHDYIPIEWVKTNQTERVTRLLCRTCFNHASIKNILENYPELKI